MDPVQGIAGVERHHVPAAQLFEPRAGLGWCETQILEIVVSWSLEHPEPPRNIESPPAPHLRDDRMAQVLRAEEFFREFNPVPFPDFADRHHREQIVPGAPQSDVPIEPELRGRVHRQGHGDGEYVSAGQTHLLQHAFEILPSHEPIER